MNKSQLVCVIDDEPSLRNALRTALETAVLDVKEYESAREFLDPADLSAPDCIVLDIRLPDMDGLSLLQQLRARNCHVPVIVMSGHGDIATAVSSMKLGAVDFLQKPFDHSALLTAIKKVLKEAADEPVKSAEDARRRLSSLSSRERELLNLITRGCPNKRIAMELGISIRTVENHRVHIMGKMRAENTAHLVHLATSASLL